MARDYEPLLTHPKPTVNNPINHYFNYFFMQPDIADEIPGEEQRVMVRPQGMGGRMAIEDLALAAYHWAIDNGLGKEIAEKRYFEIFKDAKK